MDNLIIFFAGWGMDKNPFKKIDCCNYDIEIIYNYNNNINDTYIIEKSRNYKNTYIVAWSMGVWMAYNFINRNIQYIDISKLILINGTFAPIDDKFGIPPIIYDKTLDNLPKGLPNFNLRMCGTRDNLTLYNINGSQRENDSLISELSNIKEMYKKSPYNKDILSGSFDIVVLISDTDNIIPTMNQISFWKEYNKNCINNIEIIELNNYHYPFISLNKWDNIINYREKDVPDNKE